MKKFQFEPEHVQYRNQEEVIKNIIKMIEYIDLGLQQDLGKGDLKVFSTKLLSYLKKQLIRFINNIEDEVDILSWIARNIYELRMIINYYTGSLDLITEFILLPVLEYREIEDILFKDNENANEKELEVYKSQMEKLNEFVDNHGLKIGKVRSVLDLARKNGLEDSYKVMFKLPSKYVHPSPLYFFGHSNYVHGDESRWTILVAIQYSAGSILHEIPSKIEKLRKEQEAE